MWVRVAWVLTLTTLTASGCANADKTSADGGYRTIRTDPARDTEAAARANRAGLNHLNKDDLPRAAEAFGSALTADVEFGPAHNNLGKVYYKQKDWYKAAWEFEYACKLMPRHAEPRNNLGLVLEQAGELDRAVEHYREAVALDADNVEYHANLVRALVRRGERTEEVRVLLERVIEKDTRPDWLIWARQQLIGMGEGDE